MKKVTYDDVAIIIPVYRDVMVHEVVDAIPKKFTTIICVDDGSPGADVSDAILSTRAKLVRHPVNLGQGAAIQTGVDFALQNKKINYFITFDADGQHRVEDVQRLVKRIKSDANLDIVLGSRFLGHAQNITWSKHAMLKFAIVFSNIISGIRLTDTHNGLRVFNRKVANNLKIHMPDFSHASEILTKISANNWKYAEEPVTILYSEHSRKNGQSIVNAINIAFDVLLSKISGRFISND
ncbi:MAG: glycosyltransferase family 2 protein [Candidatus Ancillula trichonymphae]|nr:glycosyltransferase family 2 protein [Candidatus Ancillula trichonymphae]